MYTILGILVLLQKNYTMQKALVVFIFICLLSVGTVTAQNFSVSNDSVTGTANAQRPEFVLKTNITNLLPNRPVNLKWERYENSFANGWLGNQICVYGNCYFYTVDTGTIVIAANSTESFDAHFGNDSLPGAGFMRVRLYEPSDSANTERNLFFGATITNTVTSIAPMSNTSANDIQIYPNPAKEYVIVKRPDITKVKRIEVYNMLGLKVISQDVDPDDVNSRIDLLDLQKGVYMIRIFDKNNNVILTKSISKIR